MPLQRFLRGLNKGFNLGQFTWEGPHQNHTGLRRHNHRARLVTDGLSSHLSGRVDNAPNDGLKPFPVIGGGFGANRGATSILIILIVLAITRIVVITALIVLILILIVAVLIAAFRDAARGHLHTGITRSAHVQIIQSKNSGL